MASQQIYNGYQQIYNGYNLLNVSVQYLNLVITMSQVQFKKVQEQLLYHHYRSFILHSCLVQLPVVCTHSPWLILFIDHDNGRRVWTQARPYNPPTSTFLVFSSLFYLFGW